jgi:DNA-binding PadR family transcriptional regulator
MASAMVLTVCMSRWNGIGGWAVAKVAVDRKWMRGSPLKGALLALLLELGEPTYAWRLATLAMRRLGPASGVDPNVVYKMLTTLVEQGLVACVMGKDEDGAPQKVYSATDLTEPAVSEWMAAPVPERAIRDVLQIKFAFSRPCDAPVLLATLDTYELQCLDRLAECLDAEVPMSSWTGLRMNVSSTWTEERLEGDLRWIMRTRESMLDYAAKHGIQGL